MIEVFNIFAKSKKKKYVWELITQTLAAATVPGINIKQTGPLYVKNFVKTNL
jgi:hypothetical protein